MGTISPLDTVNSSIGAVALHNAPAVNVQSGLGAGPGLGSPSRCQGFMQ